MSYLQRQKRLLCIQGLRVQILFRIEQQLLPPKKIYAENDATDSEDGFPWRMTHCRDETIGKKEKWVRDRSQRSWMSSSRLITQYTVCSVAGMQRFEIWGLVHMYFLQMHFKIISSTSSFIASITCMGMKTSANQKPEEKRKRLLTRKDLTTTTTTTQTMAQHKGE